MMSIYKIATLTLLIYYLSSNETGILFCLISSHLEATKEERVKLKICRAKCYQTRDSHSPRTYHCLQLGALMQLLIEILRCQPAPLPPSPAICPLSNSLTVGWPLVEEVREWAQEWGWNCPLFAEKITFN